MIFNLALQAASQSCLSDEARRDNLCNMFPMTTKASRNMRLCFARLHKLTSRYIHVQLQKQRNKPGFTQDTPLHSKELFYS